MRLVLRNDQDIKEIGEKIRDARKAKGMSQDELADIMGTDRKTISRHESGIREMEIGTYFQYCEALETYPEQISPKRLYEREDNSQLERLIAVLRTLPERDLSIITATAEQMKTLNERNGA